MKQYLKDKRKELIWAICDQDYSQADIVEMFGSNKATISRIINAKPRGWKSPWVKQLGKK